MHVIQISMEENIYRFYGRFFPKQQLNCGYSNLKSTTGPVVMIFFYFQAFTVHVFWLHTGRPFSMSTIKMVNIWQNCGALYVAQWRVPTNFILYVFTLMLVLLNYHSFVSRSGPTFEKIAFNFRHVTLCTFQCLVWGILENS